MQEVVRTIKKKRRAEVVGGSQRAGSAGKRSSKGVMCSKLEGAEGGASMTERVPILPTLV